MSIVGYDLLKNHLKTLKENADAYKKCGVKVPSLVMNISKDNGQTYVAEYITMYLHENKLRKFHAVDEMKEYRLDGTMKQVKQVLVDIRNNAVYTNEYEGVIVIDFSALANYVNESQVDYFVEEIGVIAENATMIFFYDINIGKSIEVIKDRIIKRIGNCIDIPVLPYTLEEYEEIIVENIRERGIDIEIGDDMKRLLIKIIDSNNISTAKQAVAVAEKIVLLADYSNLTPRINYKMLTKHFESDYILY